MMTVFLVREQESYKQVLPATINLTQTLHLISTGIHENIAQLTEDLETASKKKYKATYSIGSKTNVSKSRRRKEDKRKARKRSFLAEENRKSRASIIFLSLGGEHQLMMNMSQRSIECHRSIMWI